MRIFVAIDVGDAVRREARHVVDALTGKLEAVKTPPKVTWVKPAALHLTIKFIGEVNVDRADAMASLLMTPIAIKPFDAQWRGGSQAPTRWRSRIVRCCRTSPSAASGCPAKASIGRRPAGAALY